jgi:HNH endonuclease
MKNNELLEKLVAAVKKETSLTLTVIQYLRDVDTRKLHLEMGYASLFEFATKYLGYSDGAAYRRINAMRLMQSGTDIEQKIRANELTLSTAAQVESFCKKTGIERSVAVAKVSGKGTRAAERALFELAPTTLPEEKIRLVSATHTELRLIVDETLMSDLDRLRSLLSHKKPNMSYTELIKHLSEIALKKLEPDRRQATSAPKSSPETRLAKGRVKSIVWKRDQGKCTYIDPQTGRRCNSTHLTQLDHIQPWSRGGRTHTGNLRLLCRAHNQYLFQKFNPLYPAFSRAPGPSG